MALFKTSDPALVTTSPMREVAEQNGLRRVGTRPGLGPYIAETWDRRHFIFEYARARNQSGNGDNRLGQLWQVLTPLLQAGVYFLIFGLILKTNRGIDNFIAFLVTGVFIFYYTTKSIVAGSQAITGNLGLIRALHFPRVALPLAAVLDQLMDMGATLLVLMGIIMLTGQPPVWSWLLLPFAIALQTLFNAGAAMVIARASSTLPDLQQLLPFLLRTWLYLSGVFYSVTRFTAHAPDWAKFLLTINPGNVFIELGRDCLISTYVLPNQRATWIAAVLWAVGLSTVGFVYFWKAEERYGRG